MNSHVRWAARFAGAVLLACAPALAQSFSVTALGTPQPRVVATGLTTSSQTLPLGTVTAPQTIRVSAYGHFWFWDMSTARLSVTPGPTEVAISADANHDSLHSTTTATSMTEGAFDVDLSGPVQGSLWISYDMFAHAPPMLRVDVRADGVPELDLTTAGRPETGMLTVPLASTGPVRTRVTFRFSSAVPGVSVLSGADLTIGFAPNDSVAFHQSGSGCARPPRNLPVLRGQDTRLLQRHQLDFQVDHGLPNSFAMLVFGTEPDSTSIPIPPSCFLLVDPVAWIGLPTDAAGRATFRFDLFRPFPPATLYMQALPFDFSPYVLSSNRLDVILVP